MWIRMALVFWVTMFGMVSLGAQPDERHVRYDADALAAMLLNPLDEV